MSASLVARIRRTLKERRLVERGERLVVACSGGPDSTALLYGLAKVAVELSLELDVASVDHGLRPEAADELRLVETHTQTLGLRFHGLAVDVDRNRGSLQEQARTQRYAALLALAAQLGATKVAVGHTLDDQAETVMSRLLRGASIRGLGAIFPLRDDGVIRPLIDCTRDMVHGFVADQALLVVDDPSNRKLAFERVRIREKLLPALREEDPNVAVHLARLADDARLFSDFAAVSGEALLLAARSGNALCCERLMKAHPIVMREAFRFWVSDITSDSLNRAQLTALEHSVRKGGEVRLGNGWIVERSGGSLVLIHDPSRPTRSNRSQKK